MNRYLKRINNSLEVGKGGDPSHSEFACDLSTQLDRWCGAAEADSHEALRDLITRGHRHLLVSRR